MPRLARCVIAQVPHHVTQRGNRREPVFFNNRDRRAYLDLLRTYAIRFDVEVVAYCLMTNHVHLVAVPATEDALSRTLRPLQARHAQHVNRSRGWSGHLWQGRFHSSVLDESYFWAAVRYVERNPVRAGLVGIAESYPWSSAPAHCGLVRDPLLATDSGWAHELRGAGNWSEWLAHGDDPQQLELLRRNASRGLPCGSDRFIQSLEQRTGLTLRQREQGGQLRENNTE